MDTERVFVTYDKNGKELLLYKNNKGVYVDLLNKNKPCLDINSLDLIPFSTVTNMYRLPKFVKQSRNLFKSSIKSLYNYDRESQLCINDIYIGKLLRVSGILETTEILPGTLVSKGRYTNYIEAINQYKFSFQTIDDNMILYKTDTAFIDLTTGTSYLGTSQIDCSDKNNINKLYVSDTNEDLIPYNSIFETKNSYITKKKVLEEFYVKNNKTERENKKCEYR